MNLEFIQDKYLLLDTNILIDSVKFPEEFTSFYKKIEQVRATPVLDYVTHLEFIRGAKSKTEKKIFDTFIDKAFHTDLIELPIEKKIFSIAEKICLIITRMSNNQIDLGDALISAQICNGKSDKLFLVTANHQDFPVCLFNCLYTENIVLSNGRLKTVCIYKFRLDEYNKLCTELLE